MPRQRPGHPGRCPTAWAAMPGRDRSRVRIASENPSPSAPIRFAVGTRTPSKASSAVGLPRMPILCSVRSTAKPGRSVSTMKHEIRACRSAPGSVTANTVTRSATDPWLMKRFVPVITYSSPSATARVRMAAASEPASASVRAKAMSLRPVARSGNQRARCSSSPASRRGSAPSSWTARMSPVVAQARLSCSIARQTVRRSAPTPPWDSGNGRPRISYSARRSLRSAGNSPARSTSAARGATRSSARAATVSRRSRCSSVSR